MTDRTARALDVVALLRDLPGVGLKRGQVGTVVDDSGGQSVVVEFADPDGVAYANPTVLRKDLLVLSYEPAAAE
jgi:hypothetical protein